MDRGSRPPGLAREGGWKRLRGGEGVLRKSEAVLADDEAPGWTLSAPSAQGASAPGLTFSLPQLGAEGGASTSLGSLGCTVATASRGLRSATGTRAELRGEEPPLLAAGRTSAAGACASRQAG